MSGALQFILNNFKRVSVLKKGINGATELVCGSDDVIYIRKILPYTSTVYKRLLQLKLAHVPKILYCLEDKGNTYVIEEYVQGRTLQDILDNDGCISESLVLQIALQICDVLEVLHANNIIHRDIKPSNIILGKDGNIALIDFGAARYLTALRGRDTVILGTPGYAPPEQYGFAATDIRSDFYALGITLRELLGKDYQGRLTATINKCTMFDPQQRIASAAELRRFLMHGSRHKYITLVAIITLLCGSAVYYFLHNEYTAKQQTAQKQMTNNINIVPQNDNADDSESGKIHSKDLSAAGEKQAVSKQQVKAVQQKTDISTNKLSVSFTSSNLDVFKLAGESVVRDSIVQKIEQQGFKLAKHPDGKWPNIIIKNNGGEPLHNPTATMYFTDFAVYGSDFEADSWGGRIQKTQYSDLIYRVPYGQGVYKTVTLYLQGDVPVNDYTELGLFGGVNGYFATGPNPRVKIVFSADNMSIITREYQINL